MKKPDLAVFRSNYITIDFIDYLQEIKKLQKLFNKYRKNHTMSMAFVDYERAFMKALEDQSIGEEYLFVDFSEM